MLNRKLFYFYNKDEDNYNKKIIIDTYNSGLTEKDIDCEAIPLFPNIEVTNFRLIHDTELWVSVDVIYDKCIVISQILVYQDANYQFHFEFLDSKYIEFQDEKEYERICREFEMI